MRPIPRLNGKTRYQSHSALIGRERIRIQHAKPRFVSCGRRILCIYRFDCRYRELHLFADAEPNGRRDRLWDRDVAEAFLQDDPTRTRYYKEFEVSPNGFWIDLDISPGGLKDLISGLQRSVWLDKSTHTWTAELAIPMESLTAHFDPAAVWRVNFYRVEGVKEPRSYFAWQPTNTPQPNFHVPSAFGRMRFSSAGKP